MSKELGDQKASISSLEADSEAKDARIAALEADLVAKDDMIRKVTCERSETHTLVDVLVLLCPVRL